LRILYLHQYFVPPKAQGITRSYEFARRLIAAGHEVCMVTSNAMLPDEYQNLRRTTEIEIASVPCVVVPVAYANEMGYARRIRAFFQFALLATREAMRRRADVVFATSTPLTIAIPGMAARFWQRIPLVFEVRDLWPDLPIAVGALNNRVARWLARALEWATYHSAAHIVALSPGMAEGVQRQGIPAARVTVLPNASDVDRFDVPPARGQVVRKRLGLEPEQPLVVYGGSVALIHGVGYLVDIAAAMREVMPEARFLIVGSGREWAHVRARAVEAGVLDDTLWMWAPVPKTEMPAILSAATVATSFVIPLHALWDNSANKFFDGLAAGKPVVINYGGWQAELLRESGAGIDIPPDDAPRAARELAAFLRDRDRLQRAGEAARHLAYTRFNRDHLAAELEAILRHVVSDSNTSPDRKCSRYDAPTQ
jgi:glycosyltransferase involved in cell wall biosynthesis